ncbi:MAG: NYN domain-containing protein [Polyangia bacterium]
MSQRAHIFVDGNNWFHGLGEVRVRQRGELDYAKIYTKLVGPRQWTGTTYYIGRVDQNWNREHYAAQRRFISKMENDDDRIVTRFGRLEKRREENPAAKELLRYLSNLSVRVDSRVFRDLQQIGQRNRMSEFLVEKAVDVNLAVDMVVMAERDEYDHAYLLSADGDYTPAVEAVHVAGKKVYAASPLYGHKLSRACDAYIRLPRDWFDDCYRDRFR